MRKIFFPILTTILLGLSTLASGWSVPLDSLRLLLKQQLLNKEFESDEDIMAYLELTDQMNLTSPVDALFYSKKLETKLRSENNPFGKAYLLSYKGNYYWSQGIYGSALKDYFEALSIFEAENNNLEVVKLLNNIGETYKKQKNYKKSSQFLRLALKRLDDSIGLQPQLILVNLGQLYMLTKNYDSANLHLNRILKNKVTDQPQTLGYANLYKGMIKRNSGNYDSAKYYLEKSLQIWKKINFQRSIVENNAEIAKLYLDQKLYEKSNIILDEIEETAIAINTLDLLMRIYSYKIDLMKIKKDNDSLSYYYDKFIQTKDSIFNEETRSEINKLTIQYDLSQKEKAALRLELEQNILTNKVNSRSRFLIFMGIILILAIFLIFTLLKQSKSMKTAHDKLSSQKNEIENKQKELSKKSLDLANANKELYAFNQNLEERIIAESQKLSKRNMQISEFTFFNSHKLRAPVANVLGLINVLELTKDGKLDKTILLHLKTSAMELDKVIFNLKNLLDIDEEEEIDSANP